LKQALDETPWTTRIGSPIPFLFPKRIKIGGYVFIIGILIRHAKNPFGLPRINQVVDSTTGSSLLSFLDYYFGYHQIPL
jgi:hypothetical protein